MKQSRSIAFETGYTLMVGAILGSDGNDGQPASHTNAYRSERYQQYIQREVDREVSSWRC
ncbi:MAG: hypothetical protein ACR2GY_05910 [Phycisphaerales bacterium]